MKKFKISNPIRSIVNLYRDGTDSTGMHRDQYFGEANFTCGVSFGALRELEFLQEVDYQNMMQQLNQGYYGTTSEHIKCKNVWVWKNARFMMQVFHDA